LKLLNITDGATKKVLAIYVDDVRRSMTGDDIVTVIDRLDDMSISFLRLGPRFT
jgi:hypothetical protein